jgi:predicted RNA methylase
MAIEVLTTQRHEQITLTQGSTVGGHAQDIAVAAKQLRGQWHLQF